jgi:hypothetical protein
MKRFATVVMILVLGGQALAATGGRENPELIPPLAPGVDEVPVLAIPPYSLHIQLNDCLESAERVLANPFYAKLHARVGAPFVTLNQSWGYLIRADFTRDDVAPPQINRILCWAGGQLIASRLSIEPLAPIAERSHPLAVPGARPH